MTTANTASERATAIKACGSIEDAVSTGAIPNIAQMTTSEALLLGLLRQGVRKYLSIFGHGTTTFGEYLRIYEAAGVVQTYTFRNEVSMAHAATALRWQYGETVALVASIGPGALQAMAGSLTAITNGVGVYHIYGDETTYGEGQNLQQIPKNEQGIFGKITALMGESYVLHTPGALRDLLRRGAARVHHPHKAGPFYVHFPMNMQPEACTVNFEALPEASQALLGVPHPAAIEKAVSAIRSHRRIVIKAGGGARAFGTEIAELAERIGAAVVTSPNSQGLLPEGHAHNLHLGGSKGSISGNFAMANADLAIIIGSRGVCQADCSGAGYPNAAAVINVNASVEDALHYNRTVALVGDIGLAVRSLSEALSALPWSANEPERLEWLKLCAARKAEWKAFRGARYAAPTSYDPAWQRPVLTQPAALKSIVDFATKHQLTKLFDAGDVQSNAMQICEDDQVGRTLTDGGASYMGFAVSALVASGLADRPRYTLAVTGDGSLWMNPQALVDAVEHGVKGAVVVLDNRRMGAISSLQSVQYGETYKTWDDVQIDYQSIGKVIDGVNCLSGGHSIESLEAALASAHDHSGLSLIHVPVFWAEKGVPNLGSFGGWNVGSWCDDAQSAYLKQVV